METATVSLLLGCLCAGLIWWLTQGFVRRWSDKAPREGGGMERDEAPWEHSKEVYRKLLYLRLGSFALCALAATVLFFQKGTVPALALAGLGCCLQYCAYRIRTRHVQAVQKAALLTPKASAADNQPRSAG